MPVIRLPQCEHPVSPAEVNNLSGRCINRELSSHFEKKILVCCFNQVVFNAGLRSAQRYSFGCECRLVVCAGPHVPCSRAPWALRMLRSWDPQQHLYYFLHSNPISHNGLASLQNISGRLFPMKHDAAVLWGWMSCGNSPSVEAQFLWLSLSSVNMF